MINKTDLLTSKSNYILIGGENYGTHFKNIQNTDFHLNWLYWDFHVEIIFVRLAPNMAHRAQPIKPRALWYQKQTIPLLREYKLNLKAVLAFQTPFSRIAKVLFPYNALNFPIKNYM